jgi:hypothetical protein
VIVVKKQFELQIQFTEMGSQKYLCIRYACPPSFLSAVLFIRRPSGGLEGLSAVFLEGLSAVFLEGLVPIHKFI